MPADYRFSVKTKSCLQPVTWQQDSSSEKVRSNSWESACDSGKTVSLVIYLLRQGFYETRRLFPAEALPPNSRLLCLPLIFSLACVRDIHRRVPTSAHEPQLHLRTLGQFQEIPLLSSLLHATQGRPKSSCATNNVSPLSMR